MASKALGIRSFGENMERSKMQCQGNQIFKNSPNKNETKNSLSIDFEKHGKGIESSIASFVFIHITNDSFHSSNSILHSIRSG